MATWTPDPSFYPSPRMAAQAPPEQLAYVVDFDPLRKRADRLAVVDVSPKSPSYAQIVADDLRIAGRLRADIDHRQAVGPLAEGIEVDDVRELLRRGLRRHAWRRVERRIRRPGCHRGLLPEGCVLADPVGRSPTTTPRWPRRAARPRAG